MPGPDPQTRAVIYAAIAAAADQPWETVRDRHLALAVRCPWCRSAPGIACQTYAGSRTVGSGRQERRRTEPRWRPMSAVAAHPSRLQIARDLLAQQEGP